MRTAVVAPVWMLLFGGGCAAEPAPPAPIAAPPVDPAPAAHAPASVVTARDAYARATPPGAPYSAAFFVLSNPGSVDRALVGATADLAPRVELHTHTPVDGVAQMRRIEKIVVPAGGEAVLQPGGDHVMLLDLPAPLVEGGVVKLTLAFDDGSALALDAPIRAVTAEVGGAAGTVGQ